MTQNLDLSQLMLAKVENYMQDVVRRLDTPQYTGLHQMLAYHMGWQSDSAADARGKRIRPLVVLLVCAASGGDWEVALPAAAAVELLHNFSLIHDDIEDNSSTRRGRPTVWARWGIPQALNAGDTQFTLAHLSLLEMQRVSPSALVDAARLLQETCLALTQGQYLDISFETRDDVSISEYWTMIKGKTASLLAGCCGLGAIAGGANPQQYLSYVRFGEKVGLAFQALDDILGIWGDAALTGKSTESDLVSGKKSLPILYGLSKKSEFSQRWTEGPIKFDELPEIIRLLESTGAREYTKAAADELTEEAIQALEKASPRGEAGLILRKLAGNLLNRTF